MKLSGHTQPFGVLGHPIGHTLSPPMHNAAMAALGMDAVYMAYDVHPDKLIPVLHAMADMGFRGVNLTVPHKEVAFRGLEQFDASAELMRAANTIQFTDTGMVGHNTDGYGFEKAVSEAFGLALQGTDLFVAGTGGAGRAVALHSARAGAGSITLYNRTREKAERLAEEVQRVDHSVSVQVVDDPAAAREATLVVNGSSLGMKPDDAPLLPREAFHPEQKVIDLIYTTTETPFMQPALAAGAAAVNGLGMLLHQGVKAFEIWTGTWPPEDVMRRALEKGIYG